MSKEILAIVDAVSNEKALEREKVFEALEGALAIAAKKKFENLEVDIRAVIDRKSGNFTLHRRWLVVDTGADGRLETPSKETTLEAARIDDPNIVPGDYIEEQLDEDKSVMKDGMLDRITATTVKQVLQQKIKEAERQQVIDAFKSQVGKVVIGVVKRVTRDVVTIDLGNNAEAVLRRPNMLPRDSFRTGDRIRSLLLPIRQDNKNGQQGKNSALEVSRTSNEFLKELLTIEVPEIGEGQLEIINAVREPGHRAKVSIKAKNHRIDPKGACIGMKGSRIKNVSGELCNENIDIIIYDENFTQYVINAMEPAVIKSVVLDKVAKIVSLGVEDDERQYAKAIGSNGQNVKLASALIGDGWRIKVMTETEMQKQNKVEEERLISIFMDSLNVDHDFAYALVEAGFSSIEEIAYVDPTEIMNSIEGIDEEMVEVLQNNAKESRFNIVTPKGVKLAEDLINLDGMNTAFARALAEKNVANLEDLAECGTDDLADIPGLELEKAGELIMAARNLTWFKDEETK